MANAPSRDSQKSWPIVPAFTEMTSCPPGTPWQEWLIDHAFRLRKAMLAYPDGARIVAGAHLYPAVTLARFSETALASLMQNGVDTRAARTIVFTVTHYTFGHVIEEQAAPKPEELAGFDLDSFLKPFPHIRAVLQAEAEENESPDEQFVAGLRRIIGGSTK